MTEKVETDNVRQERALVELDTGIGSMPFGAPELLGPQEEALKRKALECFQEAHRIQMQGNFEDALQRYQDSIDFYPTAEAHTFLGWTYSMMGRTDEAIEACHRAIEVDPDFGNPYNDIGAYLIEKGDLDSAIPWLEQALKTSRYECYFYPHFNLGRIFESRRMVGRALAEYEAALKLNPGYQAAIKAFRKLQATLN